MNKRLRLLITCDDISEVGGLERVVANLSNVFVENGCEVWVYSVRQKFADLPYNYDKRVQFVEYFRGIGFPKPKSYIGKLWREVKRFVLWYIYTDWSRQFKKSARKSDFIICNTYTNKLNKILSQKNNKNKTIKIVHNSFECYEERKIDLRVFNNIVLLTEKNLKAFNQKYPQASFSIIPNFLPSIPKESSPLQSKIVLSVGRMVEGDQKGFFRLVDIWEIVQKDSRFGEWKLHIVGDGLLKEQIQEKIKTKNLQDSIILKPFTNQIEQEYLRASIYAMTSLFEGLPMVLVESASFGLPQISFDINTGPSDIIENEKSGFLIPDGDLAGYAEKLKALMQNQNLRESMGKRAKEIAQEKFSKEVIMKKWFELFERLSIQERKY